VRNRDGRICRQDNASLVAGKKRAKRMFAAARPSRLNDGWSTLTTSADHESVSSLTALRSRSRALIRDNAHAKRAQSIVVNNVIGQGIGLQANITNNRARLLNEVNDDIERAWLEWCRAENCHTGGSLAFPDLERLLLAEVFEAGDVLVRIHRTGSTPFSLEIIEAERLAEEWEAPNHNGNIVRQGVEVNDQFRPVAYWLHAHHPGDPRRQLTPDRLIRVPAADIFHLRTVSRWPQVRGVPWMHAAMQRLNQLGEFQEAAVVAARIGAEKVMVLKETEDGRLVESVGEQENDGSMSWNSSRGQVDILPSGTDIADWTPNYPDTNYDPFVRAALRDIAAAFGVSYESLSRDYSQSNYSSSRLSLLDDRDGWRVLQQWYIRAFRDRLHREWLQAAVLSRAIQKISVPDYVMRTSYYESVAYKPRGWSWVDPTKEVNAYKEAERAGYITKSDIISQTSSRDLEDVVRERRRELDMLADADLTTDTDPQAAAPGQDTDSTDDEQDDDTALPPRMYAVKRDYA